MKKLILSAAFICFTSFLFAQESPKPSQNKMPAWSSDKGYWVVEGNKKTPRSSTVFFYNSAHTLVYKEEITGQKLKLRKVKTLLKLKSVLEEVVATYAQNGANLNGDKLIARLR